MNSEEIQSLIGQLKAQGHSEEEIMEIFFKTFTDGKMDRKDLETLADAMGYELTDEFKNDETPDPIVAASEGEGEGLEGLTKEEVEDAKEVEPGESKEEFEEKIGGEGEEAPETDEPKEESEEEASESEAEEEAEDEDKDWEEAQKLFKI